MSVAPSLCQAAPGCRDWQSSMQAACGRLHLLQLLWHATFSVPVLVHIPSHVIYIYKSSRTSTQQTQKSLSSVPLSSRLLGSPFVAMATSTSLSFHSVCSSHHHCCHPSTESRSRRRAKALYLKTMFALQVFCLSFGSWILEVRASLVTLLPTLCEEVDDLVNSLSGRLEALFWRGGHKTGRLKGCARLLETCEGLADLRRRVGSHCAQVLQTDGRKADWSSPQGVVLSS